MTFLRWLGGIVVFFWILGLVFRVAGTAIHYLLVIAAVIFIVDWISNRKLTGK